MREVRCVALCTCTAAGDGAGEGDGEELVWFTGVPSGVAVPKVRFASEAAALAIASVARAVALTGASKAAGEAGAECSRKAESGTPTVDASYACSSE